MDKIMITDFEVQNNLCNKKFQIVGHSFFYIIYINFNDNTILATINIINLNLTITLISN